MRATLTPLHGQQRGLLRCQSLPQVPAPCHALPHAPHTRGPPHTGTALQGGSVITPPSHTGRRTARRHTPRCPLRARNRARDTAVTAARAPWTGGTAADSSDGPSTREQGPGRCTDATRGGLRDQAGAEGARAHVCVLPKLSRPASDTLTMLNYFKVFLRRASTTRSVCPRPRCSRKEG